MNSLNRAFSQYSAVVLLALVAGCGRSVDIAVHDGAWYGTSTMFVGTSRPIDYPALVTVSGTPAHIHGLCPGETGDIVNAGAGEYDTPCLFHTDDCPSASVTFERVTATESSSGMLHVVADGVAEACGTSWAVHIVFDGERQATGALGGLDARMAGGLSGTGNMYYPNDVVTPILLHVEADVEGGELHVKGLCGDGSGELTAYGAGPYAESRQVVQCPHPEKVCATDAVAYTNVTFTVSDEGRVFMAAHGYSVRCDTSEPIVTLLDALPAVY